MIEQLVDPARAVEERKLGVTMKMNEVLISHLDWTRGRDGGITRYYSGVPFGRTTISCVAAAFLACVVLPRAAAGAVTFPLGVKWNAVVPAPPAYPPAFDDNRAYIPLQSNQLVALFIKDGSTAWSVECPMSAPPAAGGGFVYAGSEGLVEARADADGRATWRRPVPGRVLSLHWDNGWLFAQTEPGPFVTIRATDGEILWQKDFGSPLSAPPAAAADRVYLPLKDGRVVALALQSGDEIWTYKMTDSAAGILPVGDRVFIGGRDNQFHSLNAEDADRNWRPWRTGADLLGLPVLDEKRVYFIALDNILRAHNRNNGTMLWKQVLPVRPFTGPLLSGETLIVSGVAAALFGYSTHDGNLVGKFALLGAENEEMLLAAPPHLTGQDLLILVTKGGQVRAVASSGDPEAPENPAPEMPPDKPGDPGSIEEPVPAPTP